MKIVKETPFQFGYVGWQIRPPQPSMTVVVKATFRLVQNGVCAPADEQTLCSAEVFYDDDDAQSPLYDTDLSLFKPRAECFVVGSCYAPGATPTGASGVAFKVGPVQKALAVFGDRHWTRSMLMSSMSEPEPFSVMPLRWERSFGGPGHAPNLYGTGITEVDTPQGRRRMLPNVENLRDLITSPTSRPEPAGSFPIPRMAQSRMVKTGTYDGAWRKSRWPFFPADFDWSFFNAAPADQQITGYFRGDEEIWLRNLHPRFELLKTRLPAVRPRAFLETRRNRVQDFREVSLNLDTITVHADVDAVFCLWRGVAEVDSDRLADVERVYLMQEPIGLQRPVEHYRARMERRVAQEEAQESAFAPEPIPATPALEAEQATPEATEEERRRAAELADAEARADAEIAKAIKKLEEMGIRMDQPLPQAQPPTGPVQVPPAMREALARTDPEALAWLEGGFQAEVAQIQAEHAAAAAEMEQQQRDAQARAQAPATPATRDRGAQREEVKARLARGESLAGEDLTGADLSRLDLRGVNFAGAILTRADLSQARLDNAVLDGAVALGASLVGTSFREASLKKSDLSQAIANSANFEAADLTDALLSDAILVAAVFERARCDGAEFIKADLSRINAREGSFNEADFAGAKLEGATFARASLVDATLDGVSGARVVMEACNLEKARASGGARFPEGVFRAAKAKGARFRGAVLDKSNFSLAELTDSDFSDASLVAATMSGCDIRRGRFQNARLVGATLLRCDVMEGTFESADLSHADLRGANLYGAEFFRARMDSTQLERANIAMTKLVSA